MCWCILLERPLFYQKVGKKKISIIPSFLGKRKEKFCGKILDFRWIWAENQLIFHIKLGYYSCEISRRSYCFR